MITRKALIITAIGFFVVVAAVVGYFIVFVICGVVDRTAARVQTNEKVTSSNVTPDGYPADDIHVRLTEYRGNAIELACEHGRISVRMRISHSIDEGVAKAGTDRIRQEIERLTTSGATPVGDYTFEFKGEWPMWKPYTSLEHGGFGYISVEFAEGVLYHQTITAYGLVAPPPKGEEYPYERIRFRV